MKPQVMSLITTNHDHKEKNDFKRDENLKIWSIEEQFEGIEKTFIGSKLFMNSKNSKAARAKEKEKAMKV